ncbi:MAG: YndJ family transporter [Hamadaea sp.]|uniref:YndJ family protein n=1 Tax=Hamadaea sp. TaxID=2024425 RepID=UPI0017E0C042|nr:YndJ family protein [Hamadaea sp.]NUR72308.1 YndJ family transporter [Hamadaea sp.]NUT18716.1 YndJ family transporter [Hamadaea sp.]
MTVLVNIVSAFGVLVVLPLGLALIEAPGLMPLRRWWLVGAIPGAASVWLPRGGVAVLLAAAYLVPAAWLAVCAGRRFARDRRVTVLDVAALTALVTPLAGAIALVAERGGVRLFGFSLGILALTLPHLHFAGFAAALIAGLTSRAAGDGRMPTLSALAVPVGTLLVLAGYFVNDAAELAGAIVLTAGLWTTAWLLWRSGVARIAAVTVAVTMALALSWAMGEATGLPHPSIQWMAATHGLANAVGFALCALLAYRSRQVGPL